MSRTDPMISTPRAHPLREIKEAGLCCGCGTCVGMCPENALSIVYGDDPFPSLDANRCIDCGICRKVCPAKGLPLRECRSGTGIVHDLLGRYEGIYYGHTCDDSLRSRAASGGIGSEILRWLLATQKVERVAVVIWEDDRPSIRLTNDPADVVAAAKSVYCYVPLNTLIPEILRGAGKVALPATPCQLAGLELAGRCRPELAERIAFRVGLFCGYAQTYGAVTAIKRHILGTTDCRFVGWRESPYPGHLVCRRGQEEARLLIYDGLDVVVPFYTMPRCFLCEDGTNELADIALGDVHSFGRDETVMITRTAQAEEVVKNMESADRIRISPKGSREIENGQLANIIQAKRIKASTVNAWAKRRGRFYVDMGRSRAGTMLESVSAICRHLMIIWVARHRAWFESRLSWQRRVGHFIYRFPCTVPGFGLAVQLRQWLARLSITHNRNG